MAGRAEAARFSLTPAEEEGWSESWSNYNQDQTWDVLDELFAVAEELGKSPAQVAINWLLHRPVVTCPVIGARTMEQFEDNAGAIRWSLNEEQMKRLDAVSETAVPRYPYRFINRFNQPHAK